MNTQNIIVEFGFDAEGNPVWSGLKKAVQKYSLHLKPWIPKRIANRAISMAIGNAFFTIKITREGKISEIKTAEKLFTDKFLFEKDEIFFFEKEGCQDIFKGDLKDLNCKKRIAIAREEKEKEETKKMVEINRQNQQRESKISMVRNLRVKGINTSLIAARIEQRI